jgi:putative DNA primase/helicase
MRLLGTSLSKHKAEEIIFFLDPLIEVPEGCLNNEDYLNVKNGLYDFKTGELKDHTPKVYSTIQLDVKYNPDAKCDLWVRTLKEIFSDKCGEQKIDILQEFFGLCLTKETKFEKALLCVGEGRNGKSVVLWVLQHLLKNENVSAVPLEMFGNRHYLIRLFGKLANISIETNAKSEVYDSTFKAVVTGDLIEADKKFKDSVSFNPFCKLVFATNNLPRVDDKSDAFFDRLLILRFNRKFSETEQNKNLKYELLSELDGILTWSLEGLKRLQARGYFKIPADMRKEIDEYRLENNNIILFVNGDCILDPNETVPIGYLFEKYKEWCEYNGCIHQKMIKFDRELMRQFKEIRKETGTNGVWLWRGIGFRKSTLFSPTPDGSMNTGGNDGGATIPEGLGSF